MACENCQDTGKCPRYAGATCPVCDGAGVPDLRPCRSPYCECEPGKRTHPGCYDASGVETVAEPDAWMQIGVGPLHEGERIPRLTKPKAWNPEWWRFEPLFLRPINGVKVPSLTREQINNFARQAGLPMSWLDEGKASAWPELERFAQLVAHGVAVVCKHCGAIEAKGEAHGPRCPTRGVRAVEAQSTKQPDATGMGHVQRLLEVAAYLRGIGSALSADAAFDCDQAARWIERNAGVGAFDGEAMRPKDADG